jgi:hypothetical protein
VKNPSTNSKLLRSAVLSVLVLAVGSSMSCMTTYDAAGRPVQSVDPALAVAGVAAAGIAGYAIGESQNNHYYYGGGYYRPRPYYGRAYCRPRYHY